MFVPVITNNNPSKAKSMEPSVVSLLHWAGMSDGTRKKTILLSFLLSLSGNLWTRIPAMGDGKSDRESLGSAGYDGTSRNGNVRVVF